MRVLQCRFVHSTEEEPASSFVGEMRRPLMHIVVLYASDLRVLHYAQAVGRKFMENGVDVFVQVRHPRAPHARAVVVRF